MFINGSAVVTNTKLFLALLEGPIIAKYLRMRFQIPDSVTDLNMMHAFTYDINGCYLSNEATLDGKINFVLELTFLRNVRSRYKNKLHKIIHFTMQSTPELNKVGDNYEKTYIKTSSGTMLY